MADRPVSLVPRRASTTATPSPVVVQFASIVAAPPFPIPSPSSSPPPPPPPRASFAAPRRVRLRPPRRARSIGVVVARAITFTRTCTHYRRLGLPPSTFSTAFGSLRSASGILLRFVVVVFSFAHAAPPASFVSTVSPPPAVAFVRASSPLRSCEGAASRSPPWRSSPLTPHSVRTSPLLAAATRPPSSSSSRGVAVASGDDGDGSGSFRESSPDPHENNMMLRRLVLVGGGHSHVQVLRSLDRAARSPDTSVTLIDVETSASYSGMVPGCAAGLYDPEETLIKLRPLAEWAGAEYVRGRVVDIDLDDNEGVEEEEEVEGREGGRHDEGRRSVRVELIRDDDNEDSDDETERFLDVPYDAVSFDIGSRSRNLDSVPGAALRALPTRPISDLVRRISDAERELRRKIARDGSANCATDVVIVGGGAAGVELALAMRARWEPLFVASPDSDSAPPPSLDRRTSSSPQSSSLLSITVVDSSPDGVFSSENSECRSALAKVLDDRRVAVRSGCVVTGVTDSKVLLSDGSSVPGTHCLWAAGAAPHGLTKTLADANPPLGGGGRRPWRRRGLDVTEGGWIRVTPKMQSTSHPRIFAAGDCCEISGLSDGRASPPKAGVYAVRAGPVLAENLTRFLSRLPSSDVDLVSFDPQDDVLKLIMCGDGTALGFKFGVPLYGKWVWELKDAIDRKFMDRFDAKYLPDVEDNEGGVGGRRRGGEGGSSSLDTSQYDASDQSSRPPPLRAADAAALLMRTDDDVDYVRAWDVLKDMMSDGSYREEVLAHVRC